MPLFAGQVANAHVAAADSELELESAAWLSQPAAQASGRAGVVKAALLLGLGCAIGIFAYGAASAKAPGPQKAGTVLSFDAGGIVQKSSSATPTCPAGFFVTHLDMMNHDADMHDQTVDAEACGKLCNDDKECVGFEYNTDADHCWVSRSGHHCTDKQHPKWVSCAKKDVDCKEVD